MHRKSAYILFLAVLGLLVIGIVMLFSTSAYARDSHGDVYFFIKRQAMWVGIGLVLCIFAALMDYHFWQRTWWLWFALALGVLVLCYVPHIGMRINGSRRWIGRGPLAAVLIFVGVLTPALGFFDVYPFRYSFVADHYQYHASMALLREDCSLKSACALSASFQKSGREVTWFRSSTRFCFASTSKTPPQ